MLLALALRLHGIHNPILDHPGWRQGDTAAIARNFALLNLDIMRPQTMYNGPPPNYVELELQIVPFLAALTYKIFGIHEVAGRLISVAFSLATVATVAFFARWLFASATAGLLAAFFYAVLPGSVYYGRTFMPDAAMVFLLTAALYASARYLTDYERLSPGRVALTTLLLALAYLAKPVAVVALVPLACVLWDRARAGRPAQPVAAVVVLAAPLIVLWLYDRRVASYAEWHWASGITQLHVLPALRDAFAGPAAFGAKFAQFASALGMLRHTILGPAAFWFAIASAIAIPWMGARSKALLWGWLAGGLLYAYVVVTVERVDYYLLLLVPLCALTMAGALARFVRVAVDADVAPPSRYALLAAVPIVALVVLLQSASPVAAYYSYGKQVYRDAVALDRTLPAGALIVMAHYGPDVQYYINRFGWEEDPALWTPFDEESAIAKGSRYFISIEDRRLRTNKELCVWLQRFPLRNPVASWPVYETDPAQASANGVALWRGFRTAERSGNGREFLERHAVCTL